MSYPISQSHNQEQSLDLNAQEVSLIDILRFLKGAWKLMALAGMLGLATSIAYLALTPKQYEAVAQITMAQIGAANNNNNNNINPLGINIEEPTLLIARLSSPTSFTPPVIAACGLEHEANAALALSKSVKLTVPKGLPTWLS